MVNIFHLADKRVFGHVNQVIDLKKEKIPLDSLHPNLITQAKEKGRRDRNVGKGAEMLVIKMMRCEGSTVNFIQ